MRRRSWPAIRGLGGRYLWCANSLLPWWDIWSGGGTVVLELGKNSVWSYVGRRRVPEVRPAEAEKVPLGGSLFQANPDD